MISDEYSSLITHYSLFIIFEV